MPRRKTTEDTAAVTEAAAEDTTTTTTDAEYTTGQDFDAESNEADADNVVEGNPDDLYYGKFTVAAKLSENAKAADFHGSDNVVFHVTRWKLRSYTAKAYVGTGDEAKSFVGGSSFNPTKAIKNVITTMNQRATEYRFNAEDAEKEQAPLPDKPGDNVSKDDSFIWKDTTTPEGQALAALGERMVEAEQSYTVAGQNERAAERAVGTIYNEARALYAGLGIVPGDKGDKSDAVKRSNAEWGGWLKRYASHLPHVLEVLSDAGLRSRYGVYAAAPDNVVEAMPSVNKATTFERKVNEAVSGISTAKDKPGFAAVAIQKLYAEKDSNAGPDETPVATTRELWEAAAMHYEAELDRVGKLRAKYEEEKAASDGSASIPAFLYRQDEVNNIIIGWLLGDVSPTDEDGRAARAASFEGSRLHRGMLGAWEKAVKASAPQTEEDREAEKADAKQKMKKATDDNARGIALMSVSEAAEVVANTIMAHGEPKELAAAVVEAVKSRLDAKAAAAKAEQEKANAADAAA